MSSEAGMPGSPAANQSKTEPMPPTTGHGDPDAAPEPTTVEPPGLDSMSVSVNDAQAPSHEAAGGHGDRGNAGVPALDAPVLGGDRQPGSLDSTGPDEQIDTDMERSAKNTDVTGTPGTATGSGDPQGVPLPGEDAAPGTSEQTAVTQGSRTPL